MSMVRFDPSALQERVNRLIAEFYSRPSEDDVMRRGTWLPPVDICENADHEIVVNIELPDMKREDFEITVDTGTLMLRGEKRMDASIKEENYHRIERSYGAFSRSFSLPPTVDSTKVSAEYRNGVLTVRLPQRAEAKPKQILVQVE